MTTIIELPNQRAQTIEKSPVKIRQFLNLAAESGATVKIWVRKSLRDSKPWVGTGKLAEFSAKKSRAEVLLDKASVESTGFSKLDFESALVQVLVFLQRGGVAGFVGPEVIAEGRTLSFGLPDRLFRIHRRKDERYELPRGVEILVKLPNAVRPSLLVTRRLHDISAGGLSVELGPTEARAYAKGLFLARIQLRIAGRDLVLAGQIQGKGPIAVGKNLRPGVKLGIAFRKLADADREFIRAYVLEHMIQYLSRLDY